MRELSSSEVVSATGLDIAKIGSTWMMSPETAALGEASGLPGRLFWACGRGGVLGDVDADVVSAAFGFVEPTLLRGLLAGRALNVSPAQAAAYFAEACCAWGSGHLGKVDDAKLNRLADLARKVAVASSPGVGALFAGWRAVPEPTTQPGGRAALALHVLREHRGGAHLSAVQAAGLTPLQSIMSTPAGRGGPERAERFGWPEPWGSGAAFERQRHEAERLTDLIVAPAYEALVGGERQEFVELVQAVHGEVAWE